MVLQACCSKALAFVFWAPFGWALEFVVFVAFFRFGEIAEQRVLFYYMAAYGATLLPTSSVGYRDTGIPVQGYRDTGIQGYKDTGIQGYRDTGIQ